MVKKRPLKFKHDDDSSSADEDSPLGKYLRRLSRKQGGIVNVSRKVKYYVPEKVTPKPKPKPKPKLKQKK